MRTTLTFLCCSLLVVFQTYAQLENSDLEECVNIYQNTNWLQFQGDCEILAEAGDDQLIIGTNSVTLDADYPPSAGIWSITSATNGLFSDLNDPKATFIGDLDTDHTIQWEFFNECGRTAESIVIGLFASNESYSSLVVEKTVNSYGGYVGEIWSVNQVTSDETVVPTRGADWFDGGNWQRLHLHTIGPSDNLITTSWPVAYGAIDAANQAILDVQALGTFPTSAKALAELRFIRALGYFWLIDMYGNVPIITETTTGVVGNDPDFQTGRTALYNYIVGELQAILPDLTTETTHLRTDTYYGRGNRWAAQALLAKMYLNSGVYLGTGTPAPAELTAAVAALDDIINNGSYSLAINYFDNFTLNNDNNGGLENIFAIAYGTPQGNVGTDGNNIQFRTLHYAQVVGAQPWNGYTTLSAFYSAFDPTDSRLGDTTNKKPHQGFLIGGPQEDISGVVVADPSFEPGDPDGAQLFYTPSINELEPNALRQAGIRVLKFEPDIDGFPIENDFPIIRFSDVVLMKAEAELRLGNMATALPLVNQVRTRAGIASLVTVVLDDILAERGFELYWEGWRRQDLIRFGKYLDAWQFKPIEVLNFVEVVPIPQVQIDLNPNLVQNPGY